MTILGPAGEPVTEAGRALVAKHYPKYDRPRFARKVAAIEAEAAQRSTAEVERLREALLRISWGQPSAAAAALIALRALEEDDAA